MKMPMGTANRLLHPFRMSIVGPTMSGKSQLIKEVLKYRQQLFTTHYDVIYYCLPETIFSSSRAYLEELKKICPEIKIIEGLPSLSLLRSSELPKLFVLDDLMKEIFSNPNIEELFTQASHHYSNSIIYTSQNYFNSKRDQTIVRNLSYKIIFCKNVDLRYMRDLSSQFSTNPKFLNGCFALLSQQPAPNGIDNKFILIDCHPQSPMSQFPIRGMILPGKDGEIRPLLFATPAF